MAEQMSTAAASRAAPPLPSFAHHLLYLNVLSFWRRTHAELSLLREELAQHELRPMHEPGHTILRLLRSLRLDRLHRFFSEWSRVSLSLLLAARLEGGRNYRARVVELEAELLATQEAETACRERCETERGIWAAERAQWEVERREWEEEKQEWLNQQRAQESVAAALLERQKSLLFAGGARVPHTMAAGSTESATLQTTPAIQMDDSTVSSIQALKGTSRPLSGYAQRLLSAWENVEFGA
ncbi:MAG: hypothetical protein SGPRY_009086 [Prymnesium sp.]